MHKRKSAARETSDQELGVPTVSEVMIKKEYPVSTLGDIITLYSACCYGNAELDLAKY